MSQPVATPSVRNITRLFRTATLEDIMRGTDWYADAYRVAETIATAHGVTVEVAAGVLAAVSPLNSWGANVNLATRIVAERGLKGGYLTVGLAKADRILAGEDILTVLNSDKVSNFYKGIISKGIYGVCIDRHAWSLAVNVRYAEGNIPGLTPKRYASAVEAYVRAARILSKEYGIPLSPAQVQAVTWVLWRRKFWSEGAFDSHDV